MIMMAPFLLMILHFSQMGFTEDLTFISKYTPFLKKSPYTILTERFANCKHYFRENARKYGAFRHFPEGSSLFIIRKSTVTVFMTAAVPDFRLTPYPFYTAERSVSLLLSDQIGFLPELHRKRVPKDDKTEDDSGKVQNHIIDIHASASGPELHKLHKADENEHARKKDIPFPHSLKQERHKPCHRHEKNHISDQVRCYLADAKRTVVIRIDIKPYRLKRFQRVPVLRRPPVVIVPLAAEQQPQKDKQVDREHDCHGEPCRLRALRTRRSGEQKARSGKCHAGNQNACLQQRFHPDQVPVMLGYQEYEHQRPGRQERQHSGDLPQIDSVTFLTTHYARFFPLPV